MVCTIHSDGPGDKSMEDLDAVERFLGADGFIGMDGVVAGAADDVETMKMGGGDQLFKRLLMQQAVEAVVVGEVEVRVVLIDPADPLFKGGPAEHGAEARRSVGVLLGFNRIGCESVEWGWYPGEIGHATSSPENAFFKRESNKIFDE